MWGWLDAQCASKTWTVRDEDAYRGPFNKRTAKPVLVVGNYWDPATNCPASVSSSKLLPDSRLLASNNWGHTAYGTGACATTAIDRYLLSGALPSKGLVCRDSRQPFTEALPPADGDLAATATSPSGKKLPPVVAPRPPSILTGGILG